MTGTLAACALAAVALAVWTSDSCNGSGSARDPSVDMQAKPSEAAQGQAAVPTETARAVNARSAMDWWNSAIEAAGEGVAGIRAAALQRGLGEMPEVARTLGNRRGGLRPEVLFRKIPAGVLLAGEGAALNYLSEHDLSHIRSVREAQELATGPSTWSSSGPMPTARAVAGICWEWAVANLTAWSRCEGGPGSVSMVRGVANGALVAGGVPASQ